MKKKDFDKLITLGKCENDMLVLDTLSLEATEECSTMTVKQFLNPKRTEMLEMEHRFGKLFIMPGSPIMKATFIWLPGVVGWGATPDEAIEDLRKKIDSPIRDMYQHTILGKYDYLLK